jgi:hypothetical protein
MPPSRPNINKTAQRGNKEAKWGWPSVSQPLALAHAHAAAPHAQPAHFIYRGPHYTSQVEVQLHLLMEMTFGRLPYRVLPDQA